MKNSALSRLKAIIFKYIAILGATECYSSTIATPPRVHVAVTPIKNPTAANSDCNANMKGNRNDGKTCTVEIVLIEVASPPPVPLPEHRHTTGAHKEQLLP